MQWFHNIQLDETLLPELHQAYAEELGKRFGKLPAEERESLEKALKDIDKDEERVLRLFTMFYGKIGKIVAMPFVSTLKVWMKKLKRILLDDAINIISRVGVLFKHLESIKQRDLLREMLERVVVNRVGEIIHVELPPCLYSGFDAEKMGRGREYKNQHFCW